MIANILEAPTAKKSPLKNGLFFLYKIIGEPIKQYYCAFLGALFCAPPFLTDEKLPEGIMDAAFERLVPLVLLLTTRPLLAGAAFLVALGFLLLLMVSYFLVKLQLNRVLHNGYCKNWPSPVVVAIVFAYKSARL